MRTGLLRLAVVVLLLAALLLASTGRSLACLCSPATPEEIFRRATVVFAGTVVSDGESAGQPAEFRVSRVWKGADYATRFVDVGGVATPDGRVTVTSCDPQFNVGEQYLVYATSGGPDKPVRTGYCNIAHLEYAQEHLDALGEGRAPEPGTIAPLREPQRAAPTPAPLGAPQTAAPALAPESASGSPLRPWSVSLIATAIALVSLGLVAVWRRRRYRRTG